MNSIEEVVENIKLGLFISGKIIQFGLGAIYYFPRNIVVRGLGLVTGKGYHEDTITGSPHHILRLGGEDLVYGGRQVRGCDSKEVHACKERCDSCHHE